MSHSREGAARLKKSNPDHGPKMIEGAHHFDKGYDSDSEVFDRSKSYPGNHQRGNEYVDLNKEIISKDSAKLRRGHFTKIA